MNQLHRLNSRAWIALLLAGILALFCAGLPVYADADSGSVTVTLCDSGSKLPISGASITIYQVADRRIQGYSVVYDFTEPFAACGVSLSQLNAPGLPEQLASYAVSHAVSGVSRVTGKDGTVTVENLPLGLYLVTQQGVVNGYYAIAPFLVTLPMTGADGKPTYEVIASPKSNPTPPTTPPGPTPSYTSRAVRKLWKDDGADRPTFITVVLMRNGVPYQTVILSDENNWQYIWEGLDVYSYWSVAEGDVPDGYQVSIDVSGNLTTLTNTRREYPENPEQLTVVKVWEDTGREDSRPECITVELLRGEEVYDAAVLNEENGWTYTWTDLPAYGNWSVREASVPDGYESQITVDGEVVVITNTRVEDIPKTTQITAKKIWSGGTPADSVTVELLRDGQPEDSVKLGEWNGWEYSWRALSPEYEWTVREVDVPKGYAVSYTVNGEVVTVTNTAKLIQTGQLNWPIPALAASGAALLLLGLILLADKRKTQ